MLQIDIYPEKLLRIKSTFLGKYHVAGYQISGTDLSETRHSDIICRTDTESKYWLNVSGAKGKRIENSYESGSYTYY